MYSYQQHPGNYSLPEQGIVLLGNYSSPPNLLAKPEIFGKPWKGSDVVLIVEEKKLHVHSTILSFASSVFEEMLTSISETPKVIKLLKEKKYEDIEWFLKNLYPQYETELGEYSVEELDNLMELCQEYKIEGLQKRITSYSLVLAERRIKKNEDCMDLLKFSTKYTIEITVNTLAEYLASRYDYYENSGYGFGAFKDESAEKCLKEVFREWDIGSYGVVKVMACMTEKHAKKIIQSGHCISEALDMKKMQKYISNLYLK